MAERISKYDKKATANAADKYVRGLAKLPIEAYGGIDKVLDSDIFYERFFEERFRDWDKKSRTSVRLEAEDTYYSFIDWQEKLFNRASSNPSPFHMKVSETILNLSLDGAHEFAEIREEMYKSRLKLVEDDLQKKGKAQDEEKQDLRDELQKMALEWHDKKVNVATAKIIAKRPQLRRA